MTLSSIEPGPVRPPIADVPDVAARALERRADVLSARERRIALALAEAAIPPGQHLPGGDGGTVARLERFVDGAGSAFLDLLRGGLWTAEMWTVPKTGLPFSRLPLAQRRHALESWSDSPSRTARWLVRGILTPIKAAHFEDRRMFEHVGCRYEVDTPKQLEPERWMQQVTDGREVDEDLELECEVVVIGSGAGGGAVAHELAKRGRAVLLLEGGHLHKRTTFDGRSSTAFKRMYLGKATTLALGNIASPVWAGKGVGGTTTINSGTCYRAPEWTLNRWGERYGLTMLSRSELDPYFERVETMLGVEPAQKHLGGVADVIARGASRMGLSHEPLRRNAPGCDGQGVCCFGCPTGAKRSADVSWIPSALGNGAQLISGAQVQRVETRNGRAEGVTAKLASGRTLRVRADAVVVAGGALLTPLLLERSNLAQRSGWLGKNLSIHPATKVMALFDEAIDMANSIPQSYSIDQFAREGMMFEGASTPLDVTAMAVPWVGERFMELMERFPNLASFGFMIQDRSRGAVRRGVGGLPLITYNLNEEDTRRMQRGIEILSEVYLEAGAERVMPMVHGCQEIRGRAGLEALRRMKLRPGDFEVSAYHPLGTCRIGTDPERSCADPSHELHDTEGVFVADGSAVPSSLGVNPQITIMAMSLRAGEIIDQRLDGLASERAKSGTTYSVPATRGFAFQETMSGSYRLASDPQTERALSFTITAQAKSLRGFMRKRVVDIEGTVRAEGLAEDQALSGTLGMDLLFTGKLPYDFAFDGDDGKRYRFAGEKTYRLSAPIDSTTRLPGSIFDAEGNEIGDGELTFDIKGDLLEFLRSFHLTPAA